MDQPKKTNRTLVIVADDENQFYDDLIEYQSSRQNTPLSEDHISICHIQDPRRLIPAINSILVEYNSVVVFLDLYFPEALDGLACLQAIKENNDLRVRSSLTYVCSLNTDNDYIQRCYSLGANGYVDKSTFPECIMSVASLLFSKEVFRLPHFEQDERPNMKDGGKRPNE